MGGVPPAHFKRVSATHLALMKEHHEFLPKLQNYTLKRIQGLQEERKGQNEKIIGLRFVELCSTWTGGSAGIRNCSLLM